MDSKKQPSSFKPCIHLEENERYFDEQKLPPFSKKSWKTLQGEKRKTALGECALCEACGFQTEYYQYDNHDNVNKKAQPEKVEPKTSGKKGKADEKKKPVPAAKKPADKKGKGPSTASPATATPANEVALFKVVSQADYVRGQDVALAHMPSSFEWANLAGAGHDEYTFELDANQFGETFHLLTSAILAPAQIRIRLDKASPQQIDMLRYYLKSAQAVLQPNPQSVASSKAEATNLISHIFEVHNELGKQHDTTTTSTSSSKDEKEEKAGGGGTLASDSQEMLFAYIRDFMDNRRFAKDVSKYACPSYWAKYWIHRYLQASGQGRKLPQAKDVDRIAVINVRKTPQAKSTTAKVLQARMEMTPADLADTMQAILAANLIAERETGTHHQFSHVILYGDLEPGEAMELDNRVQAWLKKAKRKGVTILCITSPWRTLPEDSKSKTGELHQRINRTWANFNGSKDSLLDSAAMANGSGVPSVEGLPYQVKIIAIYLALQARYGNKLCFIGVRSGFLEAAAFLGSPVFYYNETNHLNYGDHGGSGGSGAGKSEKHQKQEEEEDQEDHKSTSSSPTTTAITTTAKGPIDYTDGGVLWDGHRAFDLHQQVRLGRAGNALNTLICIDLTGVAFDEDGKSAKTVRVGEQGRRQLTGALYMYMLAQGPADRPAPLWQHRVAMRFGTEAERGFLRERWERCALLWTAGEQGDKKNLSAEVQFLVKSQL